MDKTLEIVMVAVALVIAVVIVVGMLQGRASSFEGFSSNKTDSTSCGLAFASMKSKANCGRGSDASAQNTHIKAIYEKSKYDKCKWKDGSFDDSFVNNQLCG